MPRLVAHLVMLGVVEEGPEIKNAKAQYEMLETEDCVRKAILKIKNEMSLWPRIQRRTLVLTEFGADLWRDAAPAGAKKPAAALASDA